MADTASILAVAQAEHTQAVAALAVHIRDAGWNEECAECVSLLAHADRTDRQVVLLEGGQPEEVPLF